MTGDEEDELSKFDNFWDDEDDEIKPIDRQGDPLRESDPFAQRPENPAPPAEQTIADAAPKIPYPTDEPTNKETDLNPAPQEHTQNADAPKIPDNLDDVMGEKSKAAEEMKDSNRLAEERFLRDIDEEEEKNSNFLEVGERTMVNKGDYFDLLARDPSLHDIYVAAGWDQRSFENAPVDLDLSLFLLNKDEQTREDGDFVFYNNQTACDGSVKLLDDNRTGAGDGDDECMFLDLRGVPFDVLKIRFVLSVYDEKLEGFSFDNVRNVYLRLGNKTDGMELFCFELSAEDLVGAKAIEVGTLVREGPKWFFSAEAKSVEGGHAAVAKNYGMLIAEDTG